MVPSAKTLFSSSSSFDSVRAELQSVLIRYWLVIDHLLLPCCVLCAAECL